jgi:hypothetical protein
MDPHHYEKPKPDPNPYPGENPDPNPYPSEKPDSNPYPSEKPDPHPHHVKCSTVYGSASRFWAILVAVRFALQCQYFLRIAGSVLIWLTL